MPHLLSRQIEFTKNVAKLIEYIASQGYSCTFGETWRSPEQAKLYAAQGKGILNSLHCKRLAVDLNLFNSKMEFLEDSKYHIPFGDYWEKMHPLQRWGGNFKRTDGNHYEMQDT